MEKLVVMIYKSAKNAGIVLRGPVLKNQKVLCFNLDISTNDDGMMRYLNYEQMAVLLYLYRLVISEWSAASRLTFEQAGSHASLVEWNSDLVMSGLRSEINNDIASCLIPSSHDTDTLRSNKR